ncbi:hypothetical protein L9F63_006273 [Diploptera punctata]|uniref:Uncharacterized protein n=1 Tax=Diploptera punctata TaxID=6984 RepID=A0AAD8E538_DIPPU|nr:hypothetical protein L9F63_006273 [Diploptera punctata]
MAALTDAPPASRRWDPDAWSCPDPQRCVRCDCSVSSPSTPGACFTKGSISYILDNQCVDDNTSHEEQQDWLILGSNRPYQYQPLDHGIEQVLEEDDEEDGEDDDDDLSLLLLEDKCLLEEQVEDYPRYSKVQW